MPPRAIERVLAGAAGAGLLALALMGAGLVLFFALLAQPPDAYAPEADPCCTPPATWGEVAGGVGFVLVVAAVAGLLAGAAIALLGWAATGRRVPLRTLALAPAIAMLTVAGVMAVGIVPNLDEARTRPDCDQVDVVPGSLRTRQGVEAQDAVARCGLVDGATRADVRSRLGAPGEVVGGAWHYDGLELTFRDGRVVRSVFYE